MGAKWQMQEVGKNAQFLVKTLKIHNPLGLAQAFLYFLIVVFGLLVAIPIGITLFWCTCLDLMIVLGAMAVIGPEDVSSERNFDGRCVLYAQVVWDNKWLYPWMETSCEYVLYSAIALNIFYAFFMGVFTVLVVMPKTLKKMSKVGAIQIYGASFILKNLMPIFIVINGLIFFGMMTAAIIITVGFAEFCHDLELKFPSVGSCYTAQDLDWSQIQIDGGNDAGVDGSNFHICLTIAMIGAWANFVCWFLQLCISCSQCCRGCSCDKAEEKQKVNKSMSVALRRSRMATPSGTPGHMTPRQFPPPGMQQPPYGGQQHYQQHAGYNQPPQPMMARAHMGSNPQVVLGPVPHSSKA